MILIASLFSLTALLEPFAYASDGSALFPVGVAGLMRSAAVTAWIGYLIAWSRDDLASLNAGHRDLLARDIRQLEKRIEELGGQLRAERAVALSVPAGKSREHLTSIDFK